MRHLRLVFLFSTLLSTMMLAQTRTEAILHEFTGVADGGNPAAGLIFDAAGNLYGTTFTGGSGGGGVVFKLTHRPHGWKETVLYLFTLNGKGGYNPFAGLVFDAAGNLYGTTMFGGDASCVSPYFGSTGCGVVFKLSPLPTGEWREQVLHTFRSAWSDGQVPQYGLVFDAAGNLYGTTFGGGKYNLGAVFELSPSTAHAWWGYKTLYSFAGSSGCYGLQYPSSGLTLDAAGNLYGTTLDGNCFLGGSVFELSRTPAGAWQETTIYPNFNTGTNPSGGVIFDKAGNLYGTLLLNGNLDYCGGNGCGAIYELSLTSNGWEESTEYDFVYANVRGGNLGYNYPAGPTSGVILDSAGNLYGTTDDYCTFLLPGGSNRSRPGCGHVFELSPNSNPAVQWTETTLHVFGLGNWDGDIPLAGLIFDSAGALYGTASSGGEFGYGVVFELKP